MLYEIFFIIEAVVAEGHKRATVSAMTVSSISIHLYSLEEIKYLIIIFLRPGNVAKRCALSSATQHTIPQEFGGKWGMKCVDPKSQVSSAHPAMCRIQRELIKK